MGLLMGGVLLEVALAGGFVVGIRVGLLRG